MKNYANLILQPGTGTHVAFNDRIKSVAYGWSMTWPREKWNRRDDDDEEGGETTAVPERKG